jgi:hypothetical protein
MGELRSAVDTLSVTDPAELDDAALGALLVEVSTLRDRLDALVAGVPPLSRTGWV